MAYNDLPTIVTGDPAKSDWANQVKDNFDAIAQKTLHVGLVEADLLIYVSPTGDNVNGDGSLTNPYADINRAAKDIAAMHQDEISNIKIQLLDGAYAFAEPQVIRNTTRYVSIVGNQTTPSNVSIDFDFSSYPTIAPPAEYKPLGAITFIGVNGFISGLDISISADMQLSTEICKCIDINKCKVVVDSSILTNQFATGVGADDHALIQFGFMGQVDIKSKIVGLFVARGSRSSALGLVNIEPYVTGSGTAILAREAISTDSYNMNIMAGWNKNLDYFYDDAILPLVGINENDSERDYLENKVTVSNGIVKTIVDTAGVKTLDISANPFTDTIDGFVPAPNGSSGFLRNDGTWQAISGADGNNAVSITASDTSAGYLDGKLSVDGIITKSTVNPGASEVMALAIDASGPATEYLNHAGNWSAPVGTTDEKTGITSNDTTPGYLDDKLVIQAPLSKNILNAGADEDIEISLNISGVATEYLNGAGNWSTPPDTDTTYPIFNTSNSGLVPNPSSSSGKFLKDDSTWAYPAGTTDEKVGVTSSDTTPGYLNDKVVVDGIIVKSTINAGADEDLSLAIDSSGVVTEYLNHAGNWSTPPDTNTTYPIFNGANDGLVPNPGATTGYLRNDGLWATPPDNDTTYGVFSTANDGLVPSPASSAGKFLKDDSTWDSVVVSKLKSTISITSADSPYTVPLTIDRVYADASGGDIDISIPEDDGFEVVVKLTTDPGANTVTVQMSSGNIDGAATYSDLNAPYKSVTISADGTDGWVM